jgi:hypothetical protein
VFLGLALTTTTTAAAQQHEEQQKENRATYAWKHTSLLLAGGRRESETNKIYVSSCFAFLKSNAIPAPIITVCAAAGCTGASLLRKSGAIF